MTPTPAEYHDPEHATDRQSVERHERRYRTAIRLLLAADLPDGAILDCACGLGYGTVLLAGAFRARLVIGVDRNAAALGIARARYRAPLMTFRHRSIREAHVWLPSLRPLAGIACLETLEHLAVDQQRLWVTSAHDALEPGGLMVVTCPVRERPGPPLNPWHLHEPTLLELTELMADTGGALTTYSSERYFSTAGEEAWQATATLRRI